MRVITILFLCLAKSHLQIFFNWIDRFLFYKSFQFVERFHFPAMGDFIPEFAQAINLLDEVH